MTDVKEIELFHHNEEAYRAIIKSLENNNFSFIERATGTGKSYILIKFLAEQMKGKRVLFVTTHEPMFDQFVNQDMKLLGTSQDIYEKLDLVIYPNINKKSASWYFENYDCFIFDEAHHCGAPVWGETIGEIRDLVKTSNDKVMIGATATSIRYLDNYIDVAEIFFDNNVASRLSLADAILNEILPAPLYINVCEHLRDDLDRIKHKLDSIGELTELEEIRNAINDVSKKFQNEKDVNKLLKENNTKEGEKYIVFCSNKEELKQKMEEAEYWFNEIGNIESYYVHSGRSKEQNKSQIDEFKKSNPNSIKVMFAIDIFNEGMHIPGVDGVIMARRTTSPIIYLQQLGRALSFSSRKKQIKIFDIVGNASSIDVVYNLYKELLFTAEEKLNINPENKAHYQKIIERFKIIKKGNELVDVVNKIEEFLDSNYIIKNKIQRYIKYLEHYTSILDGNFMELLQNNEIDREHKEIYEKLCKCANELSIDDIYRLNKIGVIVSSWQIDENTLDKIRINGNYGKILEREFNEIMTMYNNFYLKYKRLPSLGIETEQELAENYRNYLINIRPSKLKNFLKNANYKLNVEEILILNGFPEINDINKYLDMLENKCYNGVALDKLEIKTLKKISLIANINDRTLIKELISNKTLKIDQALNTIKEVIENNCWNSGTITLDQIMLNADAYSAYKYIKKNYKNVTNSQFKIILDMNLELFDELDMTMEERLKLLHGFNSFIELEKFEKRKLAKDVLEFIEKNGRRPDPKNDFEINLVKKHNELMKYGNSIYIKEIGDALVSKGIELSFNERIITKREITADEMEKLYYDVINTIKESDKNRFVYCLEKKKIDYLKDYGKIDYKLYRVLIRTINLMEVVFEQKTDKIFRQKDLERKIWNNKDVIPLKLIPYINDRDVTIPKHLRYQIAALDAGTINLSHSKYEESMKLYFEYMKYLEENKCRPAKESHLTFYIRDYLINSSIDDRKIYVQRLNEMNIPLLPEEIFVCGIMSDISEQKFYQKLLVKKQNDDYLNTLELYALEKMKLNSVFKNDKKTIKNSDDFKEEASLSFMEYVKNNIKENPNEELDFKNDLSILSEHEKKALKNFQLECLASNFLNKILDELKNENIALTEILDDEAKKLYNELQEYNKKCHKYDIILSEIEKINKDILLKQNSIIINDVIDQYVCFINSNGRLPEIDSKDELEKSIAKKYEFVFNISTIDEKKKMLLIEKKAIEDYSKKGFYERFVEFANSNGRLPSVLSDDLVEVELAKIYQVEGSKLNKEQKRQISLLQKKYQENTIKFFLSKKGR